ncbi:MAG TPA: hypothetical protein VKT82_01765 [Ktedonobacterales bacterium]|nr:hypothetical protein [Ktedonobacterales bacterium]
MSQQWIAQALQEHENAIQRHQRYAAAHEAIMLVLRAVEQQTITTPEALAQLEEAAAAQEELGLLGLYRQAIERLRTPHP